MLRTVLRATLVMTVVYAAGSAPAFAQEGPPARYSVDPELSTVGFTVSARVLFTLKRDGLFHDFAGEVAYDPANPAALRVDLTVYTASVDLDSLEQENLLRSDEFFDVDRHPTMHFVSTGAQVRPNGELEVTGDLTIRGITKRLVVPLKVVPQAGRRAETAFETRFQIDRTEFGLTGGGPKSRSFKVSIGRNVEIHLAIAATNSLGHASLR